VRLIRACREMGILAVAVYSEADRSALHVRTADEAVLIGPPPPGESYLSIKRILEAAGKSSAQAVHPGYGFLSENAEFAAAVQDAGLVFVGPTPETIRAMGDKARARARIQAAGIPVVPGYQGEDGNGPLRDAARALGYPVLVKAAAGGGGKGMRAVWKEDQLYGALASARRESRYAFGDERLILEKLVANARHVEFQILADSSGCTLHLFERECSIQRRHQKIIEETPSPFLDSDLRREMGAAAVAAAQSVDYRNAGTVEFIVDPESREFYFLEMNTRLQVEHPITEMAVGIDLVQWQLRLAAGEPLAIGQEDLSQRGHAIECRVYAEDPSNQFLPVAGRLLKVVEPGGPGVRVDSGVSSGDEVSVHYDPLISKVIVHAESRPVAIRRMQAALKEYVLLGLMTNLEFLHAALAHPDFQQGKASTSFVEEHFANWQPPAEMVPPEALIAAALAEPQSPTPASNGQAQNDPYNPWRRGDHFRLGTGGTPSA